ncbi:hypothetical protein RHMOL_Rhmol12G0116700 [Rhododendron molle]|uniref:Uncharacterized protein n=1 Tax=Rhododendron molle TaxID=49168 RepID=A0ACC0LGV4_RHOML|nr:hypothetical protein RHMOL_Rhmol12G0116700 [Rhododendron molle]
MLELTSVAKLTGIKLSTRGSYIFTFNPPMPEANALHNWCIENSNVTTKLPIAGTNIAGSPCSLTPQKETSSRFIGCPPLSQRNMDGPTGRGTGAETTLQNYTMGKTLRHGSFGKLKIAEHRPTGYKFAIKILLCRKMMSHNMEHKVRREIKICRLFVHPHIIRLYEVIETLTDIYVVMENMVVHRDLKPENLLLHSRGNVQIDDFGLSNVMWDVHFLKTICGIPNYAAPEVVSGKLYAAPEIDVWSCGVILYALLCGTLPFDDENIPNLFKKIKGGVYTLPSHLSHGARDLILRMLVVDPMKQITIPEIRQHLWFKTRLPCYLAVQPPDRALQLVNKAFTKSVTKSVPTLHQKGFSNTNIHGLTKWLNEHKTMCVAWHNTSVRKRACEVCLILRVNGELSQLDLVDGRERELTELFWVTCGLSEEKTNLIEKVSWLDYGRRGMQVWYPSPGVDPFKQEDFLQRDKNEEPLRLAVLSAEKPHFSHCLEWLLFTVFDAEISMQSANKNQISLPTRAAKFSLLEKTCGLIKSFSEYFDVVVSVVRKTDGQHWADLFSATGRSTEYVVSLLLSSISCIL